jgi:hypothetical protein
VIPSTKSRDRHHNLSNIRKRHLAPRVWITRLDDWDHILLHNVSTQIPGAFQKRRRGDCPNSLILQSRNYGSALFRKTRFWKGTAELSLRRQLVQNCIRRALASFTARVALHYIT